jgi:hypothetical protein
VVALPSGVRIPGRTHHGECTPGRLVPISDHYVEPREERSPQVDHRMASEFWIFINGGSKDSFHSFQSVVHADLPPFYPLDDSSALQQMQANSAQVTREVSPNNLRPNLKSLECFITSLPRRPPVRCATSNRAGIGIKKPKTGSFWPVRTARSMALIRSDRGELLPAPSTIWNTTILQGVIQYLLPLKMIQGSTTN